MAVAANPLQETVEAYVLKKQKQKRRLIGATIERRNMGWNPTTIEDLRELFES